MPARRRTSGRKILLSSCAFLLALAFFPPVGATDDGPLLSELLEALRGKGYRIVYSDEVITPAMRALGLGEGPLDLDLARRELARHGLRLDELEAGVYVVVRTGVLEGTEDGRVFSSLLEEIVVTPDRFDIAGAGFEERRRIRAKQLREAPLRLGETMAMVESLPGVAIGSEEAAPRIRGSSGQDVMVVMDGFELYEPYHLPDFRSPFSLVDTDDVDTLEVHTGGMSVEYGDRFGGLVRIETPTTVQGQSRTIHAGSASSRLSWNGVLPKDGFWAATARAWYPNGVIDTVNVGDDDLAPKMADLFAKLQFHPAPRHTLSFHILGARDSINYVAAEQDETAKAAVISRFAWARWMVNWSESATSETVIGMGHVNRERRGWAVREDDSETRVRDDRSTSFLSLSQRLSFRVGSRHMLGAGFDVRRLRADYDYASSVIDGDEISERSLALEPGGNSVGAFVSDRIRLGPKVVVELGMRLDSQGYTNDKQLSPRVNLAWRVHERHALRVSAGRYAQSQRIHELEVEDGVTEFSRAQFSSQVSGAWEGELESGWRFRLGGYARRLQHLRPRFENLYSPVELFPEIEADRARIDAERARSRGLELSIESPVRHEKVFGSLAYTLSRAEDREGERWLPRSWDQRHAATASLTFVLNPRSRLTFAGYARTGWPITPAPSELEAAQEELSEPLRNSARLGAYLRLDARYSYVLAFPSSSLRFDFAVTNLTNRDNECCTDVGVDEDTGVLFAETNYWTGIAPVFSLSWHF